MKITTTLVTAMIIYTSAAQLFAQAPSAKSVKFSPYADLTLNANWDSNEPADLVRVSELSGVKNYHLAFITDAGNCTAAWGSQVSFSVNNSWARHLTDNLRAAGINYFISFGGAIGDDISKACNQDQLTAAYEQVIQTYQPEGLDFDIENNTADVSKIMNALKRIQSAHPDIKISFTLPVMPEGLTIAGQGVVKQAQANALAYSVNIMAMDYGPAYPNDMSAYAIQAATSLFNFVKSLYPQKADTEIWQMVEVTPMIGVNDVNVEQFTLANADTLRHFAEQNKIGGLAMWSIARDFPCADKWANPTCSGNSLQGRDYEFSERFLK